MVDKKNIKKKSVLQKQKQKQSVVVNINTHKSKTQPRPRKRKPTADKENETLLEKQQKQLIYPSVIHAQPENIFDKVMSIQRQTQIDNALEQLTKTERNNLLEKAKKDSSLESKPKIVEISSRTLPSSGSSILGSSSKCVAFPSRTFDLDKSCSFPSSTPISVSGSYSSTSNSNTFNNSN